MFLCNKKVDSGMQKNSKNETVSESYKYKLKNLKKSSKPVVVLAASFGALAIVRNLSKRGILVITMGRGKMTLKSFYGTSLDLESPEDIKKILYELPEYLGEKPILFTDGEDYTDLIYKNRSWIKRKYILPTKNFLGYENLTNKSRLYRTALRAGIDAPRTFSGSKQRKVTKFPVFVKPLNSLKFSELCGKKGIKCSNANQLKQALNFLEQKGFESVTQEIIPGKVQNLYSVTLYRNSLGGIILGYVGYKIRQNPFDFGTVTSFVTSKQDFLIKKSVQLLEKINFEGVANIEYKLCQKTKKYYIIEVNGRFPMAMAINNKIGNDFIYNVYLDMINPSSAIKKYPEPKKPILWISLERDLMILFKKRNAITEIFKILCDYRLQNAHFDIKDPFPSLEVWRLYLKKALTLGLKKLKQRGKNVS